jgi:DNA polymerase III delta prime subunit
MNTNEFVWVEKWRPTKVSEVILPADLKATFQKFAENGDFPNLILAGPRGMGKTSVAKALINEIGADMLFINGSKERNIDTIRDKVEQFVTTVSFTGGRKYVLIDEADGLNPITQPALKAFIEEVSHNAGFILTANHLNRIIPELQSRNAVVEFKIPSSEKPKLAMEFMKKLCQILDQEGVSYEKPVVAALIQKWFPDWRRVINQTQFYATKHKSIDNGILANISDASIDALVDLMKKKDFTGVRKWIAENSDTPGPVIFRAFYDKAGTLFTPASAPEMIISFAKYGFQATFAVDQEVNTAGALAEAMLVAEWK